MQYLVVKSVSTFRPYKDNCITDQPTNRKTDTLTYKEIFQ